MTWKIGARLRNSTALVFDFPPGLTREVAIKSAEDEIKRLIEAEQARRAQVVLDKNVADLRKWDEERKAKGRKTTADILADARKIVEESGGRQVENTTLSADVRKIVEEVLDEPI